MITLETIHEIRPGAVLWHVYGMPGARPKRYKLLTGPVSHQVIVAHNCADTPTTLRNTPEHFMPEWFIYRPDWSKYGEHAPCYASLQDCGIGANYNNNRLFITFEEADLYAKQFL